MSDCEMQNQRNEEEIEKSGVNWWPLLPSNASLHCAAASYTEFVNERRMEK